MAIQYVWQGGDSGDYVPVEVPDAPPIVAAPVAPTTTNVAGSAPFDVNAIAQQIYGRDLSPSEQAALAGMSADQVGNVLTQSLAQFNAQQQQQQQPAGIATLPTSTQQVANTAVNPSLGVMGGQSGQGGIADIAQQQMQNAAAQTATTQTTGPSDEVKNYLDWWATQVDPLFGKRMGDRLAAQGLDLYGPESIKMAQEQLANEKANATVRALEGNPAGPVYVRSDPTTGAYIFNRIDGSADIVFPDGTRKRIASGDPFNATNVQTSGYTGPKTGTYGVTPAPTGEWTIPNWKSLYALQLANEDKQRVEAAAADRMYGRVAGPSSADPNASLPTQDPLLAKIIGNADTVTVQRALNIVRSGRTSGGADPAADALAAKLKDYTLPQDVLNKIVSPYAPRASTAGSALSTAASTTGGGASTTGGGASTTGAGASTTGAGASTTSGGASTATGSSGVTVKDYQGNAFDAGQIKNLAKQVFQNFDLKGSSGAAFTTQGQSIGFDYDQAKTILGKDPSAAEQVMMDIARQLQQKGVNDLSQIGVRNVVVDREYGDSGQTRPEIQKEFYNKDTGEKIAGQDESIGSTFTGKGATYYNLSIGADGKPVIRTQAADTSDAGMAAMLLPILLGPAGLNVSGALTGALGSAGVTGLAGQAIAQGLLGAGTSALFGGDPLKGALSGAISPVVSAGIGSILPTDLQGTTLGNFLTRAGGAAAMGALSGGDPSKAIANAALSGIAGAAMNKAGIPSDFAPALVSLIRSGTITPQAAMQMISQMGKKG